MKCRVSWAVALCLVGFFTEKLTAEARFTYASDFSERIPAQGDGHAFMDPVSFNVDEHFTIADLDVYLDITHTEVSDIQVLLQSPWQQTVVLKATWPLRWRDPRVNMHGTILDDEAEILISEAEPPYTGSFKPYWLHSLAMFDGRDAYGQWTLRIYDAIYADIGTLDRWELRFMSTAPEPISVVYLTGVFLLVRKKRKLR